MSHDEDGRMFDLGPLHPPVHGDGRPIAEEGVERAQNSDQQSMVPELPADAESIAAQQANPAEEVDADPHPRRPLSFALLARLLFWPGTCTIRHDLNPSHGTS